MGGMASLRLVLCMYCAADGVGCGSSVECREVLVKHIQLCVVFCDEFGSCSPCPRCAVLGLSLVGFACLVVGNV